MIFKKFYVVDFLQKWKMGHFYSVQNSFRRIFSLAFPSNSNKILKQKNRGSVDLFSCKIFEVLQIFTPAFVFF